MGNLCSSREESEQQLVSTRPEASQALQEQTKNVGLGRNEATADEVAEISVATTLRLSGASDADKQDVKQKVASKKNKAVDAVGAEEVYEEVAKGITQEVQLRRSKEEGAEVTAEMQTSISPTKKNDLEEQTGLAGTDSTAEEIVGFAQSAGVTLAKSNDEQLTAARENIAKDVGKKPAEVSAEEMLKHYTKEAQSAGRSLTGAKAERRAVAAANAAPGASP